MYLPSTGFYSEFKWVEVAQFMPNLDPPRVIRYQKRIRNEKGEIIERIPIMFEYPDGVAEYFKRKSYEKSPINTGLYTSIWRRKTNYIPDDSHPILAPLYFDLDDKNGLYEPFQDACQIHSYLTDFIPAEAIQIFFTGYKGFHVEVNPIVFNISPSSVLPDVYKCISDFMVKELGLTTLDTSVRDSRRMWRLPNSIHQETGKYKVLITEDVEMDDILEYASQPRAYEESPVEFNMDAAQWFREFQYKLEDEIEESLEDRIKRFEKFGTGRSVVLENERKIFNPIALFEGDCTFVKKCMEKAETNHDLSHSERLALCSFLSFTDESLEYLFYVLQQCLDYNESKSHFHVQDWVHRREKGTGGRPMSCKWLKENGLGCGNCDKIERRNKYINVNGVLHETSEQAEPSPYRLLYTQDRPITINKKGKEKS